MLLLLSRRAITSPPSGWRAYSASRSCSCFLARFARRVALRFRFLARRDLPARPACLACRRSRLARRLSPSAPPGEAGAVAAGAEVAAAREGARAGRGGAFPGARAAAGFAFAGRRRLRGLHEAAADPRHVVVVDRVGVARQQPLGGGEEDAAAVGRRVEEVRAAFAAAGGEQVQLAVHVLVDVAPPVDVARQQRVGGFEEDLAALGDVALRVDVVPAGEVAWPGGWLDRGAGARRRSARVAGRTAQLRRGRVVEEDLERGFAAVRDRVVVAGQAADRVEAQELAAARGPAGQAAYRRRRRGSRHSTSSRIRPASRRGSRRRRSRRRGPGRGWARRGRRCRSRSSARRSERPSATK